MRPLLCTLAVTALLLSLLAAHTDAGALSALGAGAGAATLPLEFTSCGPSGADALFLPVQFLSSNATGTPGHVVSLALRGELKSAVTAGAYSLLVTSARNGVHAAPVTLAESFGSIESLLTSPALPVDPATDLELSFEFSMPDASELTAHDSTLQIRLQMSEQTQRALLCVTAKLPLTPPPPPAPKEVNKGLGYACALVSVVFFGTNFLPVKQFDTGDGVFFQWIMCFGVWIVGLVVQMIRGSTFEPFAMLGGMIWCIGNMASVPIIQCVGLAVGMCLWCASSLVVGWGVGRFGLLGVKQQEVDNQGMNYGGLVACVISMGLMFMVKSVKDEQAAAGASDDPHAALLDGDMLHLSSTSGLLETGGAGVRLAQVSSYNASPSPSVNDKHVVAGTANWTERLTPTTRRLLGITLALLAGCCYGLAFNPSQYLIDSGKGASREGIDYVFSHFCGILLTSSAYMVSYSIYKRNAPQLPNYIVLPSMASGVVWAIAQSSWFVANDQIKFIGTFPIISTGPGIVATLCAILLYREIQGMRNYLILLCAAAVTFTGVLLIAFSLPSDS